MWLHSSEAAVTAPTDKLPALIGVSNINVFFCGIAATERLHFLTLNINIGVKWKPGEIAFVYRGTNKSIWFQSTHFKHIIFHHHGHRHRQLVLLSEYLAFISIFLYFYISLRRRLTASLSMFIVLLRCNFWPKNFLCDQ